MEITPEIKKLYELAVAEKNLQKHGLADSKLKATIAAKKKEKEDKMKGQAK